MFNVISNKMFEKPRYIESAVKILYSRIMYNLEVENADCIIMTKQQLRFLVEATLTQSKYKLVSDKVITKVITKALKNMKKHKIQYLIAENLIFFSKADPTLLFSHLSPRSVQ
jgi:hypothetical protein